MSNSSAGIPSTTVSVGRVSFIRKVSHVFTSQPQPGWASHPGALVYFTLSGEMT